MVIDPDVKHKHCPICRGKLIKRVFDNKESLVRRFEQYVDRTKPIFEYLHKRGYKVTKIKGTATPEKIYRDIAKYI